MSFTSGEKGGALAEVRARSALQSAGLDPAVPLQRVSSVTNEVWLSPDHAVRVNRGRGDRLAREAKLAATLPVEVGYPRVLAHGRGSGQDWLVMERVPGEPLAHLWPEMAPVVRRHAVRQIASRLAALHRTEAPEDLPAVDDPPQLLQPSATDPVAPVLGALHQAARLPNVDPILIHDAGELVKTAAESLLPVDATTLVHGDVTFENVLWANGEVTALLDVEWARPGPADLDLDVILRCCAYPHLHVAEAHASRTTAEDYADVPHWLADDYPELFGHPRLFERLRVYAVAYNTRELLAAPPQIPRVGLPKHHAINRLGRLVDGHSYLDVLARELA